MVFFSEFFFPPLGCSARASFSSWQQNGESRVWATCQLLLGKIYYKISRKYDLFNSPNNTTVFFSSDILILHSSCTVSHNFSSCFIIHFADQGQYIVGDKITWRNRMETKKNPGSTAILDRRVDSKKILSLINKNADYYSV